MTAVQIFYGGVFTASVLFAAIYVYFWHKHFDVNLTLIFTLIPFSCLGYLLSSLVTTLEGAVMAQKIIYTGGSFLQLFIVLDILSLCGIKVPRWLRTLMFSMCAVIYASVLTIGFNSLFYTQMDFELREGMPVFLREYGPMHSVFYIFVALFLVTGIGAILYSWVRKKDIPHRILLLLVLPQIFCVMAYFVLLKAFDSSVDFVPLGYLMAEIVYLLIAHRMNLYDISDTVIDSMVRERHIGYLSFDFHRRYLGSNRFAKQLIPGLADLPLDRALTLQSDPGKIQGYLDSFREDQNNNSFEYTVPAKSGNPDDDRIYNVEVNYLRDGSRRRGYIITLMDDTAHIQYMRLQDQYNEKLKRQVKEKTDHIVEMHDNLIMGLAMMVESRDNSTGGHIKRTSDGIRFLIDGIKREGLMPLSGDFCQNVIKAAPMHDLGKIAVDDAILRKPGRFTEEEYTEMKKHPAEGARVIHEILLHTDNEAFKVIAENVAHYHHERWDGGGYPDGLAGEQIPLEARIMAVADVYDALVSKRVYKEAFDFEKANRIILEGMGTQFDPSLKSAYLEARPRLEAYYREIQA